MAINTNPAEPTVTQIQPKVTSKPFDATFPQRPYTGPKPVLLLILDGWGIGPNNAGNAIARAKTPVMDKLWIAFPHTQLGASGEAVGLPHGEDGNTDAGHINIAAGSIVYQNLPRINMAVADGAFAANPAFLHAFEHVKKNNSCLHLMGLIGAGGVHSNIEHLYALIDACKQHNVTKVYVHGFTDGRDSPPTSGIKYVQDILNKLQTVGFGKLATLMGRFYAMDRDKRWERVEKAYNALTLGSGNCTTDPVAAIKAQYDQGVTDEFIEPISICDQDGQPRLIQDNDAVIFFNYRIDRPRELTRAFVMPDFEQGVKEQGFDPYNFRYEKTHQQKSGGTTFTRQKILQNLCFVTMTRYEEILPVDVAFPPPDFRYPLGKVLAMAGLRQLRMSETEKEKFVTYHINGQNDELFPGETRVILPSKGAKSYDEIPEMSTREIASEMTKRIREDSADAIICNFANPDMVAHTGNLEAAIKTAEITDQVIGQLIQEIVPRGGVILITADHGNIEEMIDNKTGEVDTAHSTYPVPLIIVGQKYMNNPVTLPSGILADVAPTMLSIMGIPKPETMTGRALI